MSQVSMSHLHQLSTGFDALADNAVVQAGPGATLGGHSIEIASAQDEVLKNVLDEIRNTRGLGAEYADRARGYFDNILESQYTISGSDVAQVLDKIMVEKQSTMPEEMQHAALDEFVRLFDAMPEDQLAEADMPADLAYVSSQVLEDFVELHTQDISGEAEVRPVEVRPVEVDTSLYEDAKNELRAMKDSMGGSPNFLSGDPTFTPKSKTFFGRSYETMYAYWSQKAETSSSIFKPFCKLMRSFFQQEAVPPTVYENKFLHVESMLLLKQHRDTIVAALREDESQGTLLMTRLTRLTPHTSDNGGAEGVISMIDGVLGTFENTFRTAREQGRLESFFREALQGACLPARVGYLQDFSMRGLELPSVLESIVGIVDQNFDTDAPMDWTEVRSTLLNEMAGREFAMVDDGGAPTAKYSTVNAELLDSLKDMLEMIFAYEFKE